MTVELKITRTIESYRRGISGTGTVDWEVHLECGHTVAMTQEDLTSHPFRLEVSCESCIQHFFREITLCTQVRVQE